MLYLATQILTTSWTKQHDDYDMGERDGTLQFTFKIILKCWVGEIRAYTTSLNPDHNAFKKNPQS